MLDTLNLVENGRYLATVRDWMEDEETKYIYNIAIRKEDYVNPITDG